MPRHAHLLANARYLHLADLDYVVGDIPLLPKGLEGSGYSCTADGAGSENARFPLSAQLIRDRIAGFLDGATEQDDLLVFFSGHGIEYEGHRLLLPFDVNLRTTDPDHLTSDTELHAMATASRARSVVYLLDMCMTPATQILVRKAASRHDGLRDSLNPARVSLVYGCQRGGQSGAASGDPAQARSSAFAASLAQAFADPDAPGRLAHLVEEVNRRLGAMDLQIPGQRAVLHPPPPEGAATVLLKDDAPVQLRARLERGWAFEVAQLGHLWSAVAKAGHLAWRVRSIAEQAEQRVRAAQRALPGQRWTRGDAPLRVLRRLRVLLEPPGQAPLALTCAEAALLLAVPFAYEAAPASAQVSLARAGSALDPQGTEAGDPMWRAWYNAFSNDDALQRHRRMLTERDPAAAEDVTAWWLLHFVHAVGEVWDPEEGAGKRSGWVAADIKAIAQAPALPEAEACPPGHDAILSAARLLRHARLMFLGYEDVELEATRRDDAALSRRQRFGGDEHEVSLDEMRVAHLLNLAARTALDPRRLPSVAVAHVGIEQGFGRAELMAQLDAVQWQSDGDRRMVALDCRHQALDAALLAAVGELEDYRRRLQEADAQLATLCCPYQGFTIKGLRQAWQGASSTGRRPHLRFELERERIMDLLMGEQLYGDPSFALRELYQNALDACRYRRAQVELRRKQAEQRQETGIFTAWEPEILLRFGQDGGRAFVECVDNGIGMAERHLRLLFARAGSRFTDSHEYHLDRARWDIEGVKFWPNSRFGIGVLSYFMLAEEIELESRRVGPEARPERDALFAQVLGSGSLFRIRTAGAAALEGGGTRLRLWLKDRAQDVAQLAASVEEWLLLPEVRTVLLLPGGRETRLRAREMTEGFQERFEPLPIPEDEAGQPGLRLFWQFPASDSDRPWTVLADGIFVKGGSLGRTYDGDLGLPGFTVVNATGDLRVNLRVDRRGLGDLSALAAFARQMINRYGWKVERLREKLLESSTALSGFALENGLALETLNCQMRDGNALQDGDQNTDAGICDLDVLMNASVWSESTPRSDRPGEALPAWFGRLLLARLSEIGVPEASHWSWIAGARRGSVYRQEALPAPILALLERKITYPERFERWPTITRQTLVQASARWDATIGQIAAMVEPLRSFGIEAPDRAELERFADKKFGPEHHELAYAIESPWQLNSLLPKLNAQWHELITFGAVPGTTSEVWRAPPPDSLAARYLHLVAVLGLPGASAPTLSSLPDMLWAITQAGLTLGTLGSILAELRDAGLDTPDPEPLLRAGEVALGQDECSILSDNDGKDRRTVDEIYLEHLVAVAERLERSLPDLARLALSLGELGVTVTPGVTLAARFDEVSDARFFALSYADLAGDPHPVCLASLIVLGARQGVPAEAIFDAVADVHALDGPAPPSAEECEAMRRLDDRHGALLDESAGRPPTLPHLIRVAQQQGWSLGECGPLLLDLRAAGMAVDTLHAALPQPGFRPSERHAWLLKYLSDTAGAEDQAGPERISLRRIVDARRQWRSPLEEILEMARDLEMAGVPLGFDLPQPGAAPPPDRILDAIHFENNGPGELNAWSLMIAAWVLDRSPEALESDIAYLGALGVDLTDCPALLEIARGMDAEASRPAEDEPGP